MINQTQKNNGISLTIEAILTDQLTTYVRIRAEGVQKSMQEDPEMMIIEHLYNYSGSLAYEIQEAVLTDQAGNRWTYKEQVTDEFEDGTVKEVVYTALQTPFVIDCHVYGSSHTYDTLNRGLYRNGDIEVQDILPYPRFMSESEELRYTAEFIVNETFDPTEELVIERYQDNYTKNMGTFLRIPGDCK